MDRITDVLAEMGTTTDEVAAALRTSRVRGIRGQRSFLNPVVRYLNRHLDIGGLLEVTSCSTMIDLVRQGKARRLDLPSAIRDFLMRYDQGLYPDLEEV